jgi:hypothetical protein
MQYLKEWVNKLAVLNNIKRIIKEQLPANVQSWIDVLLIPINNFISQVTYALTNQLTITDNFLGTIQQSNITTASFPYSFTHGLNVQPTIVFIGQIQEAVNGTAVQTPTILTTPAIAQWQLGSNGTSIQILNITGLDSTKSYNVTFVVIAK